MIIEYLRFLTNPAPRSTKILGQLQETIALEARYKRSKKQWRPHLENSQEIIRGAAKQVSGNGEVIILGSGLLLDVPIEFLSNYFSKVILVDVVHLKKIRRKTKRFHNVVLLEHDITGLAEELLNAHPSQQEFLSEPELPCLNENTELVVSTNMLSQIHLAPVFYAEKYLNFSESQLETLAHQIMKSHVALLSKLPCQCCLIADNKRIYKNQHEIIISAENSLKNIELPKPDKTWYWEIAPKGELEKNLSMTSLVYAYSNFSAAPTI